MFIVMTYVVANVVNTYDLYDVLGQEKSVSVLNFWCFCTFMSFFYLFKVLYCNLALNSL